MSAGKTNRDRNYKLFAVEYHSNALNSIRDEFAAAAASGLRRSVFVIDMDAELKKRHSTAVGDAKQRRSIMKGGSMVASALAAIARCRETYDEISRQIAAEQTFDLLSYWMNNLAVMVVMANTERSSTRATLGAKSRASQTARARASRMTATSTNRKSMSAQPVERKFTCPPVQTRQHNRTGQPPTVSKRKYISDEPLDSKLFIILIGSYMNQQFYLDLLSHGEPLQAITYFVPEPCTYDLLLPNPSRQAEVDHVLETLHTVMNDMRPYAATKSVGLLRQRLPVISRCAAKRLSAEVYAQLSWWHYDVDILRRHYEEYYVQAFGMQNVAMPATGVDLNELYETAASLGMQGHYLSQPMPAVGTEIADVAIYLDSLLNTLGEPQHVLSPIDLQLLAAPPSRSTYAMQDTALRTFKFAYNKAFNSITLLSKLRRLVVERSNGLLRQMIAHTDQLQFRNVYLTCLEYNLLRKYLVCPYAQHAPEFVVRHFESKSRTKCPHFLLPPYVQFYPTHDCVLQRLNELFSAYECAEELDVQPGYQLYHFKRVHNEVQEQTYLEVVPTRLCFRDFTLFKLDEFLADLVTPEMLLEAEQRQQSMNMNALGSLPAATGASFAAAEYDGLMALQQEAYSNFIRLNSLKARKLEELGVSVSGDPNKGQSRNLSIKPSNPRSTTSQQRSTIAVAKKPKAGLPAEHPMLYGYNLDDSRQDISTKRSKYHFDEGVLELYEEHWCHTRTNKKLFMRFHGTELNVSPTRATGGTTARNLLLRTPSNSTVRIFGAADECAKVLINYPNGLAIYHHESYAEQVWPDAGGVQAQRERKRVFTPHGAVIVHYMVDDVIVIMRYNGEVYYLYQNELAQEEEEEAAVVELNPTSVESADDATRTLNTSKSAVNSDLKRQKSSSVSAQAMGDSIDMFEEPSVQSVSSQLLDTISDHLGFLQLMMSEYNELTFMHLVVTTSLGQRINVTHAGRAFASSALQVVEWHDYFANESYAMREDGVRMVWTAQELKCFHADGTVLCTSMDETILQSTGECELDNLISASSSHLNVAVDSITSSDLLINMLEQQAVRVSRVRRSTIDHDNGKPKEYNDFLNMGEWVCEGEDEHSVDLDTRYVMYSYTTCSMLHANYATVNVRRRHDCLSDSSHIAVDLIATDGVKVEMVEQPVEVFGDPSTEDPEEESEQKAERQALCIRVSIDDAVKLCVTDEACKINVLLKRYHNDDEEKEAPVCECLQLSVKFAMVLSDNFHTLVDAISKFKNYQAPKTEDMFYMVRTKKDCTAQGFEFMTTLEPPPRFNYAMGNTRTDLNKLQTANDMCTNVIEWYDADMNKFPRFKKPRRKRNVSRVEIPLILDANLFCKVPRLLRNVNKITKFIEPFEGITHKRTRYQIKTTIDHFQRPQVTLLAKQIWSKKNWICKQEAHRRRMFVEQQRKALYYAMLRYKVYPKYHNFMEECRGQAKFIPFFDFMSVRCRDENYVLPDVKKKRDSNTKTAQSKAPIRFINLK